MIPGRSKIAALAAVARVLARELAATAALLVGVSLTVFAILALAPGDPVAALLGGNLPAGAERDAVYEALNIPKTWYGQYLSWVGNLLHGDFGNSLRTGQPVAQEIVASGLRTLFLTVGALFVTLAVAVPIAVHGALRPDSRRVAVLTMAVYVVSALPVFWLGYIVIFVFSRQFGIFPILSASGGEGQMVWLYALLPLLLLGLASGTLSEAVRHLREEVARVLNEEYVRTARAKGASVWRHAYKEALVLPVAEIVASKMPFVLGGAIIVEQVFNWPGLGRLAWQAAQDRDFPVIMGIAMAAALVVRLASFAHRAVYVAVNPRASHE
ncbi:MAG: ABC transporter permease [Betaproteobacteria bacterium]|nr:ABC transporter permease [Betaproteobacteria bacterium]